MIEIRIFRISLKNYILLHEWTPKVDTLIDMTFNFVFRQGLTRKCLYKSIDKYGNGAEHDFGIFYYFYKDVFLEVPGEKYS